MKLPNLQSLLLGVALTAAVTVDAQITVSEVYPSGSGNLTYAADWFELRNSGPSAVNITGWRVDDSSGSFASSLALNGITSIDPGQSVIFFETNAANIFPTVQGNFIQAWYNGVAPVGLTLGSYGGSGIGLSTAGDAVNIFDAGGTVITGVSFGASVAGRTFDNEIGVSVTSTPITQLSAVGVNGAFTSFNGAEIGSPGLAAVPEPASVALFAIGAGGLGLVALRRKRC